MARFFVLCALVGVALANPTPQTLPKSILGVYETVPGESKNFEEFIKVLGMTDKAKFDKNNLIGFWKKGDGYVQRLAYWPHTLKFDLPFKLGETQTTTLRGKHFEYVYTLETGATPETPVLRAKFRQTDGDVKFTIEAAFTKNNITSTYTTGNVVAKRVYTRTLAPYCLGAFEFDQTTPVSQELLDFMNTAFPAPGGLKWNKDSKYFLGHHDDHFYQKFAVDPTYYRKMRFNLDEETTITKTDGSTIKYKMTLVEAGPETTTIREEVTGASGTVTTTSVFDHKGIKVTIKTDKQEYKVNYKRVLPFIFYGTYEIMPEKTENWEAFMQGADDFKQVIEDQIKSYTLYKKGNDQYGVQKVSNSGKKYDVDFKFPHDGPQTITLENGKTLTFNATVINSGNRTYVHFDNKIGDKTFTVTEEVRPCGTVATFRRGDVVAKRYFRRVLPKTVLGTFETPEFTDAEFKTFAESFGIEEILKKHTLEFSETPEHKLSKKLTIDGKDKPVQYTIRLGELQEFEKKGKKVKAMMVYYEVDKKAYLRGGYKVDGELKFEYANEYTPEGFTATYSFNNATKIAKRTYTRKGAPVPFETLGQ